VTAGNIEVRGASVHNLKHIDLDIPRHKLVVICGVSGSGKTSLALDTLYAEGQRRYIETFSLHARQFLERLDKPEADRIDGIPASIAVRRGNASRSNRVTIATATEIIDYLRLLFAKIARLVCPACQQPIERSSPQGAADQLASLAPGTRVMIAFPPGASEAPDQLLTNLKGAGFVRVVVGGNTLNLADTATVGIDSDLLVLVDRLKIGDQDAFRLRDSLETAFRHGNGRAIAFCEGDSVFGSSTAMLDGKPWLRFGFSSCLECPRCLRLFADPDPRRFSFNSPLGACPTCEGFGFVDTQHCPTCHGTRLNEEALAWQFAGLNIAELTALMIDNAQTLLSSLDLSPTHRRIADPLLTHIRSRLGFLLEVGLGYLPLNRTMRTLSSGEAQRVQLTSVLGSNLVNMLYVLDEPSVGLHPRDVIRLVDSVSRLATRGNSVVAVEHEEELLRRADQLIELGPAAGDSGGEISFQGTLAEMLKPAASLTGEFLAGRRGISIPEKRRTTTHGWLKLFNARGHNLKNITVEFPLNVLCVVSGVSGAGKSTLVQDTLYGAICKGRNRTVDEPPLPYDDIVGCGQIDDVLLVDQSPLGRSSRVNPVTYIKAFDPIRQVFSETVEARTHNYGPGHFSFNVEAGRCTACQGEGTLQIDMQFMPDVYKKCSQCGGSRYRKEILDAKYRGKSIADVLAMTAREAFGFFRGQPKVQIRLKQLIDVGLDYLQLGQSANTLSAGESQRLKLAAHLSSATKSRTLFILDEPTTGLHFADIVTLLDCFEALLSVGHSLIVVEHNLQLLRAADYIIDMGPDAGDLGGQIVAIGTPEQIANSKSSHTGHFLANSLNRNR
jgi:excinuclease ABC subunit A